MIEEIREAISKLEKKNYIIDKINLNDDALKFLVNSFNMIYGENAIELNGINTLFGYEVESNLIDNRPVVFDVSIDMEDILKEK